MGQARRSLFREHEQRPQRHGVGSALAKLGNSSVVERGGCKLHESKLLGHHLHDLLALNTMLSGVRVLTPLPRSKLQPHQKEPTCRGQRRR